MSVGRSKYAWIVICLASIFIYLKADAIPLSSKSSHQLSSQLIDTFYDFDDAFQVLSVPKRIHKRSPDLDDNNTDDNGDGDSNNKDSSTTEKSSSDGGGFHHGDHGHSTTRHTILKPTHHPSHGYDHDDDDRNNNNSGSGGFNILEFFGTIFRLVWGFLSNIPALLFGSSSSSSSGGQ